MRFLKFEELKLRMVVFEIGFDGMNWPAPDPRGWGGGVRYVSEIEIKPSGLKLVHFATFDGEYGDFVVRADGDKMRIFDLYDESEVTLLFIAEQCPDKLPIKYSVSSGDGDKFNGHVWKPAWIHGTGPIGPKKDENVHGHLPELEFELSENDEQ